MDCVVAEHQLFSSAALFGRNGAKLLKCQFGGSPCSGADERVVFARESCDQLICPFRIAAGHRIVAKNAEIKNRLHAERAVCVIDCNVEDISGLKSAEESLSNEHNLLRTIIDNLPEDIWFKDTEGRFVEANYAVAKLLGTTTVKEIIGKTDFDLFPKELAEKYHADEQALIRTGEAIIQREEIVVDSADKCIWLSTTKVPMRDSNGKIVGVVGLSRDITERKNMEEELEKYRKHLEEMIEEQTAELRFS
ncbi:hypothetical protein LCGC14_3123680, partial [marine sediment metagenome]